MSVLRTALNPARMRYFSGVFAARGIDPAGLVTLDIGCGGGLLAEEVARLGAVVIGIDPSRGSVAAARAHARASGLTIDYRVGSGEALPLADACADIVYCVDVLEHVDNLDAVIRETARVLRPGGLYLYDTINRTRRSKLVMIKLAQDWRATACMPAGLHDWSQFIKPAELAGILRRHNLLSHGMAGMSPGATAPALMRAVRQLKKGKLSYADFGREISLVLSKDVRISYIGHATKA